MQKTGMQPEEIKSCAVGRLPRRLDICGTHRYAEKEPFKKRLTLDIALYFMVLHGYTPEMAAAELHMMPAALAEYLDKHKETRHYRDLSAYYAGERQKRNRLKEGATWRI